MQFLKSPNCPARCRILLLCFSLLFPVFALGQPGQSVEGWSLLPNGGRLNPVWTQESQVHHPTDSSLVLQSPQFEGALSDPNIPNLPYFTAFVPLDREEFVQKVQSFLSGTLEREDSRFAESAKLFDWNTESEWYPQNPIIKGERVLYRGQAFQMVFLYPIQVHQSGQKIRQHQTLSFTLQTRFEAFSPAEISQKVQNNHSVLASGEWFKIGVTEEGVYELDYAFLSSLGINLSGVNPSTIQIYGAGGGILPQTIGEKTWDDLPELAIEVTGSGDGSFDAGDGVRFYGESPHVWTFHESEDRFHHQINYYSDTTWYFLTFNQKTGKRITRQTPSGPATIFPDHSRRLYFHESEKYNALLSGRVWLGEKLDDFNPTTEAFSSPMDFYKQGTDLKYSYRVAARSTSPSEVVFGSNLNNNIRSTSITPVSLAYGSQNHWAKMENGTFSPGTLNGDLSFSFSYSPPNSSAAGWLDWFELEYEERLTAYGSFWPLIITRNVGPGQVASVQLETLESDYQIWNVTDPENVSKVQEVWNGNSQVTLNFDCDSLQKLVAWRSSNPSLVATGKKLANQDLHGQGFAELLIVTHPDFRAQAERLANFHRNQLGQTVNIAETGLIFNEFGGGNPDPTAIRDYVQHFFQKANTDAEKPKYLLLFGDGSYDFKNIASSEGSNFVPTYQSRCSYHPPVSYTSDDYFGFQDVGEGFWGEGDGDLTGFPEDNAIQTHLLDIGVGRIPCKSVQEAEIAVDKILDYSDPAKSFGNWRNRVLLVADYKSGEPEHTTQAKNLAPLINTFNSCLNIDKVFMDNYQVVPVPDGFRVPEAKDELLKRLDQGALIVNYTGHGGETGWSNGKIFEIPDIKAMENTYRYPAFLTATCEFGRWDDPGRVCGAEHLFLQEDGGAIVLFTTVRVVYSSDNSDLNREFYRHAVSPDPNLGRYPTTGEILMETKNATWGLAPKNNRNFTLLGDPALTLSYPRLKAEITEINGSPVMSGVVDSLPTLTRVQVSGEVHDQNGQLVNGYQGDLVVTVFDKPQKFVTRTYNISFDWQKNRVFNGLASVRDGKFSFEFVVPLDISYENGLGKISLYLSNAQEDGAGCYGNIYLGGTDSSALSDDRGPEVSLFINDETFVDGGMTGADPVLIAELFDENGINTVGTGIGHELVATLDDDPQHSDVLNEYYVAARDDYRAGRIEFPYKDLAAGPHTLHLKVWDVANNSGEGTVDFVVSDDAGVALGHVLNYPNPFSTSTKFFVEHNRHGSLLDCRINIYTVSGLRVKSLESTFFAEGNLYSDLEWDGLDEWGDAIGRGVYVYQVTVRDNETGEQVSRFEKLVLLR